MSAHSSAQSSPRVFLHSITPSFTSLLGSLCAGIALSLVHVGTLGIRSGFFHTTSQDDELLTDSFAKLTRSTQLFAHNELLNNVLLVAFWGLIGFIVYALVTQLIEALMGWYDAEHEVLMSRPGYPINHPRLKSFFVRLVWRFLVGLLFIISTLLLLPVFRRIVSNDHKLLDAHGILTQLHAAGLTILLWMLIIHLYVVLARWYRFRTRVFSEVG